MNNESEEDRLAEWLSNTEQEQSVSKELFKKENISVRTEVSDDEIKAIAKANFICNLLELKHFPAMIQEFLELRVSHKRKSRAEFIKSLSQKMNFGFGNRFNNNRGGLM